MSKGYSKNQRIEIFNKYNGRCAYCGCILKNNHCTIDHIKPRHRGYLDDELSRMNIVRGDHKIENLNPCCSSCNSSKSTLTIEKWRIEIEKKHDRLLKYESSYNLLTRFKMVKRVKSKCIFYFEKVKL